jgi:hypothetical protein
MDLRPLWWGDFDVVNNPPEVEYKDVMKTSNDIGIADWMSKTVSTSEPATYCTISPQRAQIRLLLRQQYPADT